MKAPKFRFHVDSVIMTVASLTLVTSVFFLFQDGYFFQDGDLSDLKPVGTFKTSRNDVRRRVDSGMTWSNIDAPEKVYEGDSIFTGDKSEATISLDNGNTLKIDPKSLVVIHTLGNKTEIDLQYGSLQGKIANSEAIFISQNGKTQQLNGKAGSQIRIVKAEKEQSVRVQVTKGDVNIDNEVVHQDEVVKISAEKPVIEKATITLVSPENAETNWLPMGAPLPFKWKATGTAANEHMKVQFSHDGHFDHPFYTADASGDHFAVADSNVPEGSFYWRVKPAKGEPSLPALTTAYPDVPPIPVLPKDTQAYKLDTEKGEASKTVFFTWEDKSGSIDFQLEVAHDKDFKDIVKSKTGKEKVERIADLPPGNYFWHVKGLHPDRSNAPFSRLMTFAIQEGARVPLAPQITKADLTYTIPQATLAQFPAALAKAGRGVKPVNMAPLAWTPLENAESYEVEVALDEDFTNSVRHDNGTSTVFAPKEVRPGELYMRVRAVSPDGRRSPASKTAALSVMIPPPTLDKVAPVVKTFKSDKEMQTAKHDFNLSWKPQRFATAYELQWGADPQFTKSKTFRIKETSHVLKVSKPDTYAARVRALDASGNPISEFSGVEVASYKKDLYVPPVIAKPVVETPVIAKVPRFPASPEKLGGLVNTIPIPLLKEPAAATALVSLEDAPTFVTFKWKPFASASYYTIQISSDADFTKVVSEQKVKSNGYIFQKGLPEGKVFWRVRAHTAKGYSGWSDPSDINVIYQ
jgi:hypothetical protein